MATKDEIRPIYSELQGLLAQARQDTEKTCVIYATHLWEHYNTTIDELSKISETDYSRYKIVLGREEYSIDTSYYRGKLGGIIARLYAEYFKDDPTPFPSMPSTSIQVNQQQNQSVQIEIAIEMTELITKKLSEAPEGSKEKSFLEKVKSTLRTVSTVPQLIMLIITTAKEFGLSIDQLKDLLS